VPNIAVFCSSLISCFPGTLLKYFLQDSEMVPVAPIIMASPVFYIPHALCFYIIIMRVLLRRFYFVVLC
jgi:hypothetical protein